MTMKIITKKKFTKIEFNSDDNLPLYKPQKFYKMTLFIRLVLKEDGKWYPQLLLDKTLCVQCKKQNLVQIKRLLK